MRVCKKCGTSFEIVRCPACSKRYMQDYKIRHPERFAASVKASLEKTREKRLLWKKEYRSRRQDLIKAHRIKYKQENYEKVKAQPKLWKKANPLKVRATNHTYRAKKRSSGKLSCDIVEKLLVKQKGRCACCGEKLGKDFHIDHIMPIALGGLNLDENVQLLKAKCNLEKNAKHPVDFMQERGFLL